MWKYVLPPVITVATLWLVMSIATNFYLHWIEQSHQQILNGNVASIQVADDFQRTLRRLELAQPSGSPSTSAVVPIWESELEELSESLGKLQSLAHSEEERADNRELMHLYVRLKRESMSLLSNDSAHFDPQVAEAIQTTVGELSKRMLGVNSRHRQLIKEASTQRLDIAKWVNLARIAILTMGPMVGVWLGWRLSHRLQKSVGQIAVILRQVDGDDIAVGNVSLRSDGTLDEVRQEAEAIVALLRSKHYELEVARSEVVRSERLAAVGQLAAGLAHELRNPMTSVKLLLQHASKQLSAANLQESRLQLILDEIGRMESTIQGLLDFACDQPLKRRVHDLPGTLRRAINLVDGRLKQKNIRLELDWEENLSIDGDPIQLHQVFVNLIINAIDATPNGGQMTIRLSRQNESYIVQFCDTGDGIPTSMMSRLFEPFATTKERGTGLGLAVSRRIVDQHGGSLIGENSPDGGAVFTVELPSLQAEHDLHGVGPIGVTEGDSIRY